MDIIVFIVFSVYRCFNTFFRVSRVSPSKNNFELLSSSYMFTVVTSVFSLRSVKVQQRILNDNTSTLIDMTRVSNTI